MAQFKHRTGDLKEETKVAFTAMSKYTFYFKHHITGYVLNLGYTPISPFANFDYFLTDYVDRKHVIKGNNNLVRISDELWVFGPISDGVLFEIKYAKELGKPVKYFKIIRKNDIQEIVDITGKEEELEFEEPKLKEAFSKLK
ncbi:hypothetical protein ACFL24_00870 [Patescibacteria group bacterium]